MASNPGIPILLTRAADQSTAYAADLRAACGEGLRIEVAPLLEIVPVAGAPDLNDVHQLLFTSVNGVAEYAARTARRDIPCLCVGGKTAETARAAGLRAEAAEGTADDLLQLALQHPPPEGQHFLYLRGRHRASALAEWLTALGHATQDQIVYDQRQRPLAPGARALFDGTPLLVPLFSPRTARLFAEQAAQLDLSGAIAICLSNNVAAPLAGLAFRAVRIVDEPAAGAVTREIAGFL
ncbi:MAG: uroporphyrinogen-III synthase [Rhodobacteraceae bacterium]|nr:uroporphyrinogen-III synthase [Paracoccaceae bacterium]